MMARTHQAKFLEALEAIVAKANGYEVVEAANYSNTGRWLVSKRDGFDAAAVVIFYDFQGSEATLQMHFAAEAPMVREVYLGFTTGTMLWWPERFDGNFYQRNGQNTNGQIAEVLDWIAAAISTPKKGEK